MKFSRYFSALLLLLAFASRGQSEVKVYPNPFTAEISIITHPSYGDSLSFEVFDVVGRSQFRMENQQVSNPETLSFFIELKAGIYITVVELGKEKFANRIIRIKSSPAQAKVNLVLSAEGLDCVEYPFNIFPNPSRDGLFYIRQPNTGLAFDIEIWNTAGKRVFSEEVGHHLLDHKIDLGQQSPGLYFIRLVSVRGAVVKRILLRP